MKQAPSMMRAVGYRKSLPIDDPDALVDVDLPVPKPGPRDLLIEVEAVSVNPVDVKVRARTDPAGAMKVLGYDAAGVVTEVGTDVSLFNVGDEVFYAGSINRPGTNSAFHLVDERITGHKPSTLTFPEAAALPLTTITAWEALFDRLHLTTDHTGSLLVVAAAGGVGSMLVQLARALTSLTVIGTASRPESQAWARELGAHHVVDHHGDLAANVRTVAPEGVDYLFSPHSAGNVEAFAAILRPYGHIVAIDDPGKMDMAPLKPKSIAWHWEYMFTAPTLNPTSHGQHDLLNEAAALVDAGMIRTTLNSVLRPIDADTLRQAHAMIESGATIGKIVIARS